MSACLHVNILARETIASNNSWLKEYASEYEIYLHCRTSEVMKITASRHRFSQLISRHLTCLRGYVLACAPAVQFRKGVEKAPEKEAEKESLFQREMKSRALFEADFEKVNARNGVVFRWPTSKFGSLDTLRNLLVDTLLVR
jgi:hypothetical protein